MESVIFKLKEPQKGIPKNKQKPTLVNLFFHFGYYELQNDGQKKYIPLKYSTGMKILPYYWNDKPTYRAKQSQDFQYKNFNTKLKNLEGAIIDLHRELENNGITPTPEHLREELKLRLGKTVKQQRISFLDFIESLIQESISGTRLTKNGKRFSITTIKGYRTTQNHLKLFAKETEFKLNFDSIDLHFYAKFNSYCLSKNYAINTIGTHIKNIKVFMKEAYRRGLTKNNAFADEDFRVVEEETDQIYLTEEEIQNIYGHSLKNIKHLIRVRDLFIVACYTGLRFSDLRNLKDESLRIEGTNIRIRTQKTGELVVIPMHWMIKSILEKYDGDLPKPLSNQKMNKYLKDIGKLAEIDSVVFTSITKGGKTINTKQKKYELITVHTARRSFATNMFLANVPTISIMKLTGHKTEKSFMKYIRISQEDNAKRLQDHPFFSKVNLQIR